MMRTREGQVVYKEGIDSDRIQKQNRHIERPPQMFYPRWHPWFPPPLVKLDLQAWKQRLRTKEKKIFCFSTSR